MLNYNFLLYKNEAFKIVICLQLNGCNKNICCRNERIAPKKHYKRASAKQLAPKKRVQKS